MDRHARALKLASEMRQKAEVAEAKLKEGRSRKSGAARLHPQSLPVTPERRAEQEAERRFGGGRLTEPRPPVTQSLQEVGTNAAADRRMLRQKLVRETPQQQTQSALLASAVSSSLGFLGGGEAAEAAAAAMESGVEQKAQHRGHIAVHQLETRLRQCFGELRALREQLENSEGARNGMARKCVALRATVAKLRQRCTQLEAQRVADGKEAKADMHCVRDSYKRQTLEMMAQIDALRAQLD